MIDVSVLDVKPHPDQATNNPGCWAVQFRVVHAGAERTFWRWHNVRKLSARGQWLQPDSDQPSIDQILACFWSDAFGELNGFDFEEVA